MFWEIAILLISTVLLRLHLHKRRLLRNLQHIPVIPYDLPVLGGGWRFLFQSTEQIMTVLIRICGQCQTPSIFWFGPVMTFLIANPEDLKAVYTSPNCLDKPYLYDFFGGGDESLMTAPTHIWRKDRKAIQMTFNNRILQSFVPIFNEKSQTLVAVMEKYVDCAKHFDVSFNIFACTMDMICATTLDHELNVQLSDENREFADRLEELSVSVAERMANVWLHPHIIYRCTKRYYRDLELTTYMKKYSANIRRIKQKEYNEKSKHLMGDLSDVVESVKPQHFVYEMLKLYDRGEIYLAKLDEQLITMIVGGYETSALSTSNTVLMLAMHPDVQQQCYEEIVRVCGPENTDITMEQIAQLDYLEMVIKETMRLLPVGPYLARTCLADTQLSNCIIPAGTNIILGNYNVQRDKTIWGERANEFDPDNFRPERVVERDPFSYVPFSAGPRNCVGIKYAWISVKIMLVAMLRAYRFRTDLEYTKMRFKWDITLKVRERHMVQVERRLSPV